MAGRDLAARIGTGLAVALLMAACSGTGPRPIIVGPTPSTPGIATESVIPLPTPGLFSPAPASRPTTTATPQPTPQPTASPVPWHKAGEFATVHTSNGAGLITVSFATKLGSTCGYSSAGRGKMYVGVAVFYAAGSLGLFYSSSDWSGHSQDNLQYEAQWGGICYDSANALSVGQLGPNLSAGGVMVFEIPRDTKHFYLDWRDMFSGARETWKGF